MLTLTLEMPVRSPNLDCETGCLNGPQVFLSLHEFRSGSRFKLRARLSVTRQVVQTLKLDCEPRSMKVKVRGSSKECIRATLSNLLAYEQNGGAKRQGHPYSFRQSLSFTPMSNRYLDPCLES